MTQPQPHEHRGDGAQALDPPERSGVGLIQAFAYPVRGARLVYREHRELARYWAPPIVLAAIAMTGAVWLVLEYRDPLFELMWPATHSGDGWLDALARGAREVVRFVATVLATGLAFVLALFSAQLAGAPFYDALSGAVEALHMGQHPESTSMAALLRDAARSVQLVMLKLLIYVAWMLPLWIIALAVPVVGPVVQAVLGFVLTVAFVALDHLDWAAARHGLRVGERMRVLRTHPGPVLSFGLCVWCLLLVPVVNLFLMPAAVAGGTLLFLDLGISPRHRLAKSQPSATAHERA